MGVAEAEIVFPIAMSHTVVANTGRRLLNASGGAARGLHGFIL